jgi:GT2 family glycosyltransferase
MPDVSIVIVSWNTKKILSDCLESLERCRKNLSLEVIVVDNASLDGTAEYVRERFPEVQLVQNSTNLGFARANNIGVRLSEGQYVCLVNSDVVVPEGCLKSMVEYMNQHAAIGMLGPKMVLRDGRIGQSCMRFPSVWNSFCRALALDSLFKGTRFFGGLLMTDFRYDRTIDVDVLTGWFWMVRRDALTHVGFLDERFFMYGEDIDWSRRFHKAGWRVVFFDKAEAFHYCAASSAIAPARFYIEMNRANMQYYRTYHNQLAVAGLWLATWFHQIVRILGYGAMYVLKPSGRLETRSKLKRSAACLFWLMGIQSAKA